MFKQDGSQASPQDIILDSIADGVFTVDHDWNITYFNRAAEMITGVTREQALGKKCYDVFRANICQDRCALRRTMEGEGPLMNLRIDILASDGHTIPISVCASTLRDEAGVMVGGVETFRDLSDLEMLRREIRGRYETGDIISKSPMIQKLLEILPAVSASDCTVLLEGPSGSGKELIARTIHTLSGRKGKLVAVNIAALPETLQESEIFGYVKGAFTGADKDKPGRFALAKGGTLLLDEIGDCPPALQVKLLRVLQEKEYEPLGATAPVKTDARIITATNKPLAGLVARGAFREDLFYRLNVARLIMPALAQRKEDIPLLVGHFIRKFNALQGKEIKGVTPEAATMLLEFDYPGNVRQLENFIEYAVALCEGDLIQSSHLPQDLRDGQRGVARNLPPPERPLREAEAEAILEALTTHGGNRRQTAAYLGIDKTTLWRKMKKYNINV
jgi:PAS domain S-box-containing protein